MIEFETVDGDRVWVQTSRIVLVTQAKTMEAGKPIPMLGVTLVQLDTGAPLFVKSSTTEAVLKIEVGYDERRTGSFRDS